MSTAQLVVLGSFKNDGWLVERWLQRNTECADAVVTLDDGSSDDTRKILENHPKMVKVICNPCFQPYSIFDNVNRLLQAAAMLNPEWVIYLDSDNLLDARFALNKDELLRRPDVGRYHFHEITLWRGTNYYRTDKPEQYMRRRGLAPFLIKYTPELRYTRPDRGYWKATLRGLISNPSEFFRRIYVPKNGILRGVVGYEVELEFVNLHYHFVNWEKTWQRHMTYAVYEAIQYHKKPSQVEEIVNWASRRLDETGLQLASVKPEWGVL